MTALEKLEYPGAMQLLLALVERQRYVTEVLRKRSNPNGFISQTSLDKCRVHLEELGLIKEEMEESARPRTYLVITDKGRRVAQKIREIQEILEEN